MSVWDSRQNNFDFLRLALAVLVVYSHAYPLGLGSETREPFVLLTRGQVTGGGLAVDLFFIMSGYLIAASAERSHGMLDFLSKRVKRIYPAFVVATLLSLLIVLPWSGGMLPERGSGSAAWNVVQKTLRLTEFNYSDAFRGNPLPNVINGSVWSISYEFWCYIGVAVLAMTGFLKRRGWMIALFASSCVISLLSLLRHWNYGGKLPGQILGSPQFWARLLPLYLAGVVFYLLRDRIALRGRYAALAAILLSVGCLFNGGCALMLPTAGAYLIFWLAYTPAVRLPQVARFGDFSYGAYLYAFPVEQLFMQAFGRPVRPLLLFACATPLALLCAVASWYGVERWFLQPSRKREVLIHSTATGDLR